MVKKQRSSDDPATNGPTAAGPEQEANWVSYTTEVRAEDEAQFRRREAALLDVVLASLHDVETERLTTEHLQSDLTLDRRTLLFVTPSDPEEMRLAASSGTSATHHASRQCVIASVVAPPFLGELYSEDGRIYLRSPCPPPASVMLGAARFETAAVVGTVGVWLIEGLREGDLTDVAYDEQPEG